MSGSASLPGAAAVIARFSEIEIAEAIIELQKLINAGQALAKALQRVANSPEALARLNLELVKSDTTVEKQIHRLEGEIQAFQRAVSELSRPR